MTLRRSLDAHGPNDFTSPLALASNVGSGEPSAIIGMATRPTTPQTTSSLFAEVVTCEPTDALSSSEVSPEAITPRRLLLPPGLKPYYEHNGIAIIHGDCREILPTMRADVLVTDPPYGVNLGTGDTRGDGHGLAKATYASYDDTKENWSALVPGVLTVALSLVTRGVVFAGKHVTEIPPPSVVGGVYVPSAVGRNQWGFSTLAPIFFYGSNPRIAKGGISVVLVSTETSEVNGHPCPKPYGWMKWLVDIASLLNETIIDPFMGSGTTLRAAKNLGRQAIGIEIEERYCEIAAKRLSQEVFNFAESIPDDVKLSRGGLPLEKA